MDVYETDPTYSGHSNSDPKSEIIATQIPFIVYTSPLFQQHFPNVVSRIKKSQKKAYRTDSLIYTLMDVAGISFEGNNEVEQKSLFNEKMTKKLVE